MILECKNLCMNYGNHEALKNISFRVDDGDYICVVGENGSGKSTLLKGIAGLNPIKSGEIKWADKKECIGYMPQQTALQNDFPASVFEVVLSGFVNKSVNLPFFTKREKELALSNMKNLNITHLKNNCFSELSGGQRQRVLLARALCATKRILFLDEPITGLDPAATLDFYALIKELNEKNGITVVMASHDIRMALKHAGKILHLETGVLFFGNVPDYLKSDAGGRFL